MRLWMLVALTTITVACSNEDLPVDKPQTTNKVTIHAGIAEPKETRMSVTDTGTFGAENLELKWETGDSFDVYGDDGTKKATFKIENATEISPDGKSATFTYADAGEVPEITNGTAYFGETDANQFIVPGEQSATDIRFFSGKKLPMKAENITIDPETTPNITFKHMAYVLKFSFRLPEGASNPETVSLTSSNNNALSTVDGTYTTSETFALNNYEFNGKPATFDAYIPLFPGTSGLGDLTVQISGDGGEIGTFGPTASGTAPFEAGKIYSAKIAYATDKAGSLVETSVFDQTVAGMVKAQLDKISYESGDGESPETTYEIASASQLRKLIFESSATNNYAGKYFKLTTDIHVTADIWTPLGTTAKPFLGNFDGNGHSITGTLNLNNNDYGFFGRIADNTSPITIKNLTVNADVSATGKKYIGGIIGSIRISSSKGDAITIENCHFNGHLTAGEYVGGIVGSPNIDSGANQAAIVEIKNCTTRGSITTDGATATTGGIIGIARDRSVVSSCINYAELTGTGSTIGGIVGNNTNGTIKDCTNYGKIDGIRSIGGIVGNVATSSSSTSTFIGNNNYGTIGSASASNVGGIAGTGGTSSGIESYTNNTNYSEDIAGNSFVGGLWGSWSATGSDNNDNNINETSVPDKGANLTPYPPNP